MYRVFHSGKRNCRAFSREYVEKGVRDLVNVLQRRRNLPSFLWRENPAKCDDAISGFDDVIFERMDA